MIRQKNWNSIQEIFQELNKHCNYVILRNYEELHLEHMVMEEHDDIDLLCDDQRYMRELLGAVYRPVTGNFDHFFTKIAGKDVKFGIRYIGDDYYDRKWEQEMLSNRILHPNGFYVMNDTDYFYSLLYHALIQKKELSEDYRIRLAEMGKKSGIELNTPEDYRTCLETYMTSKGYCLCYPKDTTIPLQTNVLNEVPVTGYTEWKVRKRKRIVIRGLRFIRKRIRRNKNG